MDTTTAHELTRLNGNALADMVEIRADESGRVWLGMVRDAYMFATDVAVVVADAADMLTDESLTQAGQSVDAADVAPALVAALDAYVAVLLDGE